MYCRALACDFDGTGAAGGRLAPEVEAILRAARERGFVTLLVTGRVLEDLEEAGVDVTGFDAIVAENGAVVWLPGLDRRLQLGTPPPERFLGALRARGIPFHAGAVVVGTWDRHADEVLDLIRHFGLAAQLIFNREAMMVLPSGVDKGIGVQHALAELSRSERSMIAFGDAENDRPLLELAEIGVAARGAVPSIAAMADERLPHPASEGVAHYIRHVLERDGCVPTPPRQHLVLGRDATKSRVVIPSSGTNVMISGDPRSGKSWLAGLVAERLLERGYRMCVLDAEGDYQALGRRPRALYFGNDAVPLLNAATIPNVLRDEPISLILNLAALSQPDKVAYVDEALAGLEATRAATGLPHWVLIDEAHYFLHEGATGVRRLESRSGNYLLVTYRPSLVAPAVHARVAAHLVTRTTVEEERYFVTGLLQAGGPRDLVAHDALAGVEPSCVGLLLEGEEPRWQVFTPGRRLTGQAHHGRKYADTPLPENKAFRFLAPGGGVIAVARSVTEFCAAVERVPPASLRHHLLAGDFSRWATQVLGDVRLGAGLRKLELTTREGAAPSAEEVMAHVRDWYLL